MNRSIGGFILYIATALYLLAAGIIGLVSKQGEIYKLIGISILPIVLSLAAVVAGVLLLLHLFGIGGGSGFIDIVLIVFAILWIIFIIMADFVKGFSPSWAWLLALSIHLMVLGVIASGTSLFGGN